MTDNTAVVASLDPASPKVADREVSHAGDLAKVQLVQLAHVTGPEGSHVLESDDVATSDTGDFGLIPLIKRLLQKFTAQIPAALTTNGAALKTGAAEVVLSATVVAGQTVQGTGVDLAGLRNWMLYVPATFDGTTVMFQTSYDGVAGNYKGVYDILNNRVSLTVTADRYYDIPGELMAVRYLKLECGTAQATTDTVFQIIGKS